MVYEINEIVSKIGEITIEGNIIPNEWYLHLRNDKGKIQTNAALILADIVYWYRPIPIHDIKTGALLGYGKKFKEDLVQISYKYLKGKFGFTNEQSRSALTFLEKKQLIFRDFRDLAVDGHALNNVMYIGIYPQKILEITTTNPSSNISFITKNPSLKLIQAPSTVSTAELIPSSKPFHKTEKDWSAKYTAEQKEFLSYLLNLQPAIGDLIEKSHATWWIKNFGIEKIKIALQVYWQQVEKSKQDTTIPMPGHIGKYVRKALNDGILPSTNFNTEKKGSNDLSVPYSEKSEQGVGKLK